MGTGIFSIGVSAIQNAQLGLMTTEHNISNANTPGYNRQRIIQASNGGILTGSGFIGQGSHVSTVERMYDEFLVNQVNRAQTTSSELDAYYAQISQIDNMLADTNSGLSPALQDFFSGVQQVAANPAQLPARQAMVSAAHDDNRPTHCRWRDDLAARPGLPQQLAIRRGKGEYLALRGADHENALVRADATGERLLGLDFPHLPAIVETHDGAIPGRSVDRRTDHGRSKGVIITLADPFLPQRMYLGGRLDRPQLGHLRPATAGKGIQGLERRAAGQQQPGHDQRTLHHLLSPSESSRCWSRSR